MSKDTSIPWADSSVNPTMGCSGCELEGNSVHKCYAAHDTAMYGGGTKKGWPRFFKEPETFPGRMAKAVAYAPLDGQPRADKPWLDGCPRIIFVGDEGDLFDKTISLEYIRDEVYLAVTSPKGKRHQWMFLTKQARRMRLFFEETVWERAPFDAQNLWAGISATNQKTFDARVARLEETQVFSKYVSLEPMHGPIVLGTALDSLDLVIVGGESANAGTYRDASIFHLEWAEDIVKECAEAKVPVFVKQLGSYPLLGGLRYISTDPKDQRGEDWSTWPEAIRVRQMREAMLGLAVTPPEQGELLG